MADDERLRPGGGSWNVHGSRESHHCINPALTMEEEVFREALRLRNSDKPLIKLSIATPDSIKPIFKADLKKLPTPNLLEIPQELVSHGLLTNLSKGDPAVFGSLPPPSEAYEGVQKALDSHKFNGYVHSSGMQEARQAVVEQFSTPEAPFTAEDVVLTTSASGALIFCLTVLCEPSSSILIPSPGYGLYKCLAMARGLIIKRYRLKPDKGWEIDLEDLESQIDVTTSAIVFNSPGNPCGCVYSDSHQRDLLRVAEKHRIPIIADDVYQGVVFSGHAYTHIARLSKNVPILSCNALSKRYMVPGWRLGWIIIHDRNNSFSTEVAPGLARLARKNLNPCSLVQAALPHIFTTPQSYHDRNVAFFQHNAQLVYEELQKAPGLTPIMPAGAMYMMVCISLDEFVDINSDIDFTKKLLIEESVFCLPGTTFLASNCFRIVLMMPDPELLQAMERIISFCTRHYMKRSHL